MQGWLDVLGEFTPDEVRAAWADYQRTGPRSGKGALYRPDAGALYQRIVDARVAANKARKEEERRNTPAIAEAPREVVSMERRREIMREAGFDPEAMIGLPKRFGGEDG